MSQVKYCTFFFCISNLKNNAKLYHWKQITFVFTIYFVLFNYRDMSHHCITSFTTTLYMRKKDVIYGSRVGNATNPQFLEVDSWVFCWFIIEQSFPLSWIIKIVRVLRLQVYNCRKHLMFDLWFDMHVTIIFL